MSITETLMRPDPYAPLAKLASTVLVAIEKLRLREALKDEEQSSFPVIAKELSLLSRARELGTGAPIPSYLHRSFCTLVAIDVQTPPEPPLEFKTAGEDLALISKRIESGSLSDISTETLDRAQEICYQLLVHLNDRRPVTTWM
jgi:hypothetical protein